MPCELGHLCQCTPKTSVCRYWLPSIKHRYYNCLQWTSETRIECDLPKSACAECPYHFRNPVGRPRTKDIDLVETPEERRRRQKTEWQREQRERKRWERRFGED